MKNKTQLIIQKVFLVSVTIMLGLFASCNNLIDDNSLVKSFNNEVLISQSINPLATVEAPGFFEGGLPKNRRLIVSFTKAMNTENFWERLIITDSLGKNLKDHFCKPVWFNEDTLVEIMPDPENPIDLKNKSTFDIYVTIPGGLTSKDGKPLQNPIDYRYRINDTCDDHKPLLLKAESVKNLVKGELTVNNQEDICNTNHIQSELSFNFEASDDGEGLVWAKFVYSRIYDVNGNLTDEKEESKLIRLTNQSFSDSYYQTLDFDLSDSKYKDGLYRICAYAADASGNLSQDFAVWNIIRDTSFYASHNTSIDFDIPQEPSQSLTKAKLNYFANLLMLENLDDDLYFTCPGDGQTQIYSTDKDDFSYKVCWGLSLDSLSEPEVITKSDYGYELPPAYRKFRLQNINKDIYLSLTYTDAVGNSNTINTVIPHTINFFNYEVQEGSTEGFKKIKLNYSTLSTNALKFADMPEKQGHLTYRVYYGKFDKDADKENIELVRNFSSNENDDSDFEIEDNSVYLAYIQPVYSLFSKTNGQGCGNSFGPLYEVLVDTYPSGEDPGNYNFTVSKTSDGMNTGTFTIDVDIQNGEKDVKYYPCFSSDGQNWNTYNTLSFTVDNPLRAPFKAGESWALSDAWKNKSLFEAREELKSLYPQVKAQVKILAVKGKKAVYSNVKEILFTRDEDNIAPEASDEITSHDSMLSFDGRYFIFDGIIREDDLNTNEIYSYYYVKYDENWGNNLSVLTEDQIKNLPGAVSRINSRLWKGEDSSLNYSLSPIVPVNGLKDGKYLFFAKVSDLYGNQNYITLGKAQLAGFKNKLKVAYDPVYNQFTSTLALTNNEVKLGRNMINIQAFAGEEGWYDFYGKGNELQNCRVDSKSRLLSNTTRMKSLKKGTFYRLIVQGFNDNTYDESTNTGVNKINARPYSDQSQVSKVLPFVQNETEYDLYTEETISNPVYYYVPAQDEDMSRFKGSFFKNTVAISTNKPVIVNLISSMFDLGSSIDEWERRGKLIKTYYFKGDSGVIPFRDNDVRVDMLNSDEEGLVYYVMVVHFANNTSEMSNVYTMQK